MYLLHEITGDLAWLEWLHANMRGLVATGAPETRTDELWQNQGQCCGDAGIAELSAGGSNVGSTEATRQLLGLDPQNRSLLLTGRAGLLTLTATTFYVLRLGGFREKIKETAFEAPRAEMQFTANDLTIGKHESRHWLVSGFPDGRYLLEPQVLGKAGKPSKNVPGSDAFLAELGNQAQHFTGNDRRA